MSEDQAKKDDEVLQEQLEDGLEEFKRTNQGLFLSAVTAGLEIGFSVLLMGILFTVFKPYLPKELHHLVVSIGYPLGFIFVIIGRSQLFTEQTALAMIPLLNGRVGVKSLGRLWLIVFLGNILGGTLFAILLSWIGPMREIISPEAFTEFAHLLTSPKWYVILGSATLAGWMMGLLGWLISASQETISRIILVSLVTLIIGFGKLHHCIVGSVELVCAMITDYEHTNLGDYGHAMLFTVLGNILGGAFFVGVIKYTSIKS